MEFSVLIVFPFLCTCCNFMVRYTCRDDRLCRNKQGVLVPLTIEVCDRVDEIGYSWFLERQLFDPICSVITVAKSSEED